MKEKTMLEYAIQQLTGFVYAYEGYDIVSLCSSMGLTKKEYKQLKTSGDLNFLGEKLLKELEEEYK